MSPERQRELEVLLHEALERPAQEREAWLERHCQGDAELLEETLSLIAHEKRAAEFLEAPALVRDPSHIGGFRIVRRLATGGSAIVYEARPEDGGAAVALKVLRGSLFADERQLRQLRREVKILARLRHPAIARLLEARSTEDGQQFFTMELVRGRQLDDFVRETSPSRDELLWLFRELCDAVHHAHQCGVIHRDLKPANILVDGEGRPRILDFGLARLVQNDTRQGSSVEQAGEVMGTLPYMSPEQVRGRSREVGATSDVYSLGVVFYELLTGELPFDLAGLMPYEAVDVICGYQPVRPSVRRSDLRGDLETILLKTLEKEPEQRYASAAALAEDIARCLDQRPIVARRPGVARRLQAAWKENRGLAAGALAIIAVLAVFAATSWAKNRALRAEQELTLQAEASALAESRRATAEAEKAQAVIDFMLETLAAVAPEQGTEREVTVREVLDGVAHDLGEQLPNRPLVREALHETIGLAYFSVGRDDKAVEHLTAFVGMLEARLEKPSRDLARGHHHLGGALARRGDYPAAREQLEASLSLHRELHEDDAEVALVLQGLARVYADLGMRAEAESKLEEALALGRDQLVGNETAIEVLQLVAEIRWIRGDTGEAEDLLREALERTTRAGKDAHPRTANLLASLGQLLTEQNRLAEAEELFTRAVEIRRARLPARHVATIATEQNLATLLVELGRYEEARPILASVLGAWRAVGQTEHEDYASTLSTLGAVAAYLGEWEEAERSMREGLEIYRASKSKRADHLANHLGNLAHVLLMLERTKESEELTREALELRRATFGPTHPEVAKSLLGLGELRLAAEDLPGAEDYFREALDLRRAALPARHPEIAEAANGLAAVLMAKGELEEAEELWREALASLRATLGDEHPSTARVRQNLGDLLMERGRTAEARTLLDNARPREASFSE